MRWTRTAIGIVIGILVLACTVSFAVGFTPTNIRIWLCASMRERFAPPLRVESLVLPSIHAKLHHGLRIMHSIFEKHGVWYVMAWGTLLGSLQPTGCGWRSSTGSSGKYILAISTCRSLTSFRSTQTKTT